MKDLIEKILNYLPQFFLDYGSLFSGPKRFIAAKDLNSDDTFREACLFLAICIAVITIIRTPFRPPNVDLWASAVFAFWNIALDVVLVGTATRLGWWIVRGKASAKAIFVTYMYFSGIINGLMIFLAALMLGFIKATDRPLYDEVRPTFNTEAGVPNTLYEQLSIGGKALFICGLLGIFTWFYISWGAYRQINNVGRIRSLAAAAVAVLLWIPASAAFGYITAALRP
jgi:hypothetical protein